MSLYKFGKNDKIRNVIKAHPKQRFLIYDSAVSSSMQFGSSSLPMYAFVTKDGSLSSFSTITTSEFNTDFQYGDTITSSAPMLLSSSLSRSFYDSGDPRSHITALRNSFDYYKILSPHFAYSSSFGDKSSQALNFISIPSIFYGSSIKKGSLVLDFYVTGNLVGRLQDVRKDGTLVQTKPVGSAESGSIAGVCMYKEGIIVLTGSWGLTEEEFDFRDDSITRLGSWLEYASPATNGFSSNVLTGSSFNLEFEGTQRIPNLTMFCTAPKGEVNHSNNPTALRQYNFTASYNSSSYIETKKTKFKNVSDSMYNESTGSFVKTTYISEVFVYDEDKNLLGIAKLAKPIRKTEDREFTVKLKVDL